jgi:two-component system, sensor histidine kinase
MPVNPRAPNELPRMEELCPDLARRCERLESMITSMDQGVAFADERGLVSEINERYLELLGKKRDEVLGHEYGVLDLDTEEYQVSAIIELFAKGAAQAAVAFNQKIRDIDVTVTIQPVHTGRSFHGVIINVIDVTPLVEARLSVEREKIFLEQVINIAGAAICIVNRDDVITNVNEEFTHITGLSRDESLGKERSALLKEDPETPCKSFEPDQDLPVSKRQTDILTSRGERLTILKNAAPLYDAFGRPVGGIESFVDVTELIRTGKKAEEANRLKSVFLANMSHEIRTPLNALLGLPQLLARTTLTSEQREYLDTMRSAGQSLLVIVNDILDFSKIEAGRITIVRRPVNLRGLLDDIRRFLAGSAMEKGLEFIFHIDPLLPAEVETDAIRLRQILVNFLSNAIKFTAKGEVSLTADAAGSPPIEGRNCLVRFSVSDTGLGITPEQRARIFEPFTQADDDVSRHHGGTGLGLSISKRLVDLLGGGEIKVRSRHGQGSEFSFTLPLPVVSLTEREKPARPRIEEPVESPDFSGLSVLVAEDNAFNRFLLRKVLEKFGIMNTFFADNGLAAVEEVLAMAERGQTFDVIFMDLRMPGLDGLDASRKIREAGIATPIVALTAQALSEAGKKCKEAGMDYYFPKPYDIKDLEGVLASMSKAGRAGERR